MVHVVPPVKIFCSFSAVLEGWFSSGDISPDTLYGIELLNEPRGENVWKAARDVYYPGKINNCQITSTTGPS